MDVLEAYLDGKLDAKAMYDVERLSLEDPFVAEALEGLSRSPRRRQSLSLLQKQLQARIAQKPVNEKRWRLTSHRLSIAAAAAVLFITVSLLFWMRENNRRTLNAESRSAKITTLPVAPPVEKARPEQLIEEPVAAIIPPSPHRDKVIAGDNADVATISQAPKADEKLAKTRSVEQAALNEIVVTAAGTPSLPPAEPADGWEEFNAYLLKNKPAVTAAGISSKKVKVTFGLDTDGTPVNISPSVLNAPALTANEQKEIERLLQNGPKWKAAKAGGSKKQIYEVEIQL
ncbi:hypothetical protein D9M68_530710 [compost metagenome]